MSFPRTTHVWLGPLYDLLSGRAPRPLQLGSPTSYFGLYGTSGVQQPTALGITGSDALGGATGTSFFDFRSNGGTGTQYWTYTELINRLKRVGVLGT